ncbi:hypothetical protein CONPUDRAFT_168989 [Coniophora puteana RWD-64-598 SS2]|uniref:Uncharacterized protein n=1 Tax=Coniophora puteana (strain RWD-64-598) TaxID=741705 RepID=A0A5M3MC82_CONPW|nr:uncharacterized protein CONPUDRAFT_168989 [Coniophora puteana RWD-64-598 SS2]EIW76450.1 hypothetical protein CONPUDRAFT_168989 [Coniophora puteana RWD-64-598 SS2]
MKFISPAAVALALAFSGTAVEGLAIRSPHALDDGSKVVRRSPYPEGNAATHAARGQQYDHYNGHHKRSEEDDGAAYNADVGYGKQAAEKNEANRKKQDSIKDKEYDKDFDLDLDWEKEREDVQRNHDSDEKHDHQSKDKNNAIDFGSRLKDFGFFKRQAVNNSGNAVENAESTDDLGSFFGNAENPDDLTFDDISKEDAGAVEQEAGNSEAELTKRGDDRYGKGHGGYGGRNFANNLGAYNSDRNRNDKGEKHVNDDFKKSKEKEKLKLSINDDVNAHDKAAQSNESDHAKNEKLAQEGAAAKESAQL